MQSKKSKSETSGNEKSVDKKSSGDLSTGEKFSQFYRSLLERSLAEVKKLKQKSGPSLHAMIDKSADRLAELEHISEKEAAQLSEYLKRDLHDAADYMVNEGKAFSDWLAIDLQLVEDKLLELFMEAADHTTVDLLELKRQAERAGYASGDVAGPGGFSCDECGHVVHLHNIKALPPCPRCQSRQFHRAAH